MGGSAYRGRHLEIRPRFDLIESARAATAMMDVSDGLAWDLHRLLRASACGGCVDLDVIPVHADALAAASGDPAAALDAALHDGEDHELLATSDLALPGPWVRVGEIESGEGLRLTSRSGIAPSLEGSESLHVQGLVARRAPTLTGSARHEARITMRWSRDGHGRSADAGPSGRGRHLATRAGDRPLRHRRDSRDAFRGPGAGKTTLVRGLAEGLGIRSVSSPTYMLMQLHEGGRLPLSHFDAWMEGREKAYLADGADRVPVDGCGLALIEWAERVEEWPGGAPASAARMPWRGRRAGLIAVGAAHGEVLDMVGPSWPADPGSDG